MAFLTLECNIVFAQLEKSQTSVTATANSSNRKFLTEEEYLKGDVNGDGSVNITDVVAVINIIATGFTPTEPAVVGGFCPDSKHPHIIDLGEAGKWSCCNVGATAPWEYGGYYAWGCTEEVTPNKKSSYKYENMNLGTDISGTSYDTAHELWGGNWYMPSLAQVEALKNKCTKKDVTLNGVVGKQFTSSNGASIFLPSAGERIAYDGAMQSVGSNGHYWTSSPSPDNYRSAYEFGFGPYEVWTNLLSRNDGMSIRAIAK